MLLRTFTAADMPAAMKMVREALGDEAIILTTENLKGKKGVTVTAALEKQDDAFIHSPPLEGGARGGVASAHSNKQAPPPLTLPLKGGGNSREIERIRHDLNTVLHFHNIPDLFISKITRYSNDKELASMLGLQRTSAKSDDKHLIALALEKMLRNYFSCEPLRFDNGKMRAMLVGPPGIGKTLTIAKMAAQLTLNKKHANLAIFTTDNKRAGGVEQLQAFTNILGLTLHVASTPKELKKMVEALPPTLQILVDTAGCNPYDHAEMDEIKAFTAIKTIEPVLVLPAGGDSLEAIDMVESFSAMPIKRLLVTRADTTRRFGGILSAAAAYGLSFCNLSSSSSIIDALQPVDGALLAQLLLKHKS